MSQSITSINTLLIDIKTVNNSLLIKLQQSGFNCTLHLGHENEYTVKSLINRIDTLAIHFLTITANREQFMQRTGFAERKEIESILIKLYISLKETQNTLYFINQGRPEICQEKTLSYTSESDELLQLPLANSIEYIDMLKPYSRMLELVIAQERIHALSAVLETLLHKDQDSKHLHQEEDVELTDDQNNALELSHYLVKQAL
jgi:hypothetical protein